MYFKKIYNIALFLLFFIFFIYIYLYLYYNELGYLIISSNLLILNCILYTFNNIKYHIISCIFYFTIYIFLLSMPTIDYFKYGFLNLYITEVYSASIMLVMLAVTAIFIGSIIAEYYYKDKLILEKKYSKDYITSLRFVSIIFFLLSYPCYLILNIEKVLYRFSVDDYYVYYATFESSLPSIVHRISDFTMYALIIYLATKPKKIYATLGLLSYVFANFLILLTGTRNPFILSLLFSFVYYFIRNQSEKDIWIGKKEKFLIVISSLPIIIGMGALNYIREGENVNKLGIFDLLIDFVYKQGTSFNVLAWGYMHSSDLPVREFRNYTFGHIIDYLNHGTIGSLVSGGKHLSEMSRLDMALDSNSLAHNLSFLVYRNYYLQGHGIGDSYIINNYIDYGFLGVFIIGLFLGFIFVYMLRKVYVGKILSSTIVLVIIATLYFMPRGNFSESFSFILTIPFWISYLTIWFLANLITKNNKYLIRR